MNERARGREQAIVLMRMSTALTTVLSPEAHSVAQPKPLEFSATSFYTPRIFKNQTCPVFGWFVFSVFTTVEGALQAAGCKLAATPESNRCNPEET